jgi:hypothetical protein
MTSCAAVSGDRRGLAPPPIVPVALDSDYVWHFAAECLKSHL